MTNHLVNYQHLCSKCAQHSRTQQLRCNTTDW